MKNIILLVLIALAFCLTELTLSYFYPTKKEDWPVWEIYFKVKDGTYDAMFFAFSLLLVWNVKEIRAKAICVFLLIMTGGSVIDKVIFGINKFVYADIGLIVGGLIVSIYLYLRWRKISKTG